MVRIFSCPQKSSFWLHSFNLFILWAWSAVGVSGVANTNREPNFPRSQSATALRETLASHWHPCFSSCSTRLSGSPWISCLALRPTDGVGCSNREVPNAMGAVTAVLGPFPLLCSIYRRKALKGNTKGTERDQRCTPGLRSGSARTKRGGEALQGSILMKDGCTTDLKGKGWVRGS